MNDTVSPAAQVIISIVPIVGIVIGGVIVFFYLLWRHREVSLMVKTGTYEKAKFDLDTYALLLGMLLTGVGVVLSLFFCISDGLGYELLGGLIPFALGVSLLGFTKIRKKSK